MRPPVRPYRPRRILPEPPPSKRWAEEAEAERDAAKRRADPRTLPPSPTPKKRA